MNVSDEKTRRLISEIRHQLEINVSIAKRDHPEGLMVNGERKEILPHSQQVLAGHITDKLDELERHLSALSAAPQPVAGQGNILRQIARVFAALCSKRTKPRGGVMRTPQTFTGGAWSAAWGKYSGLLPLKSFCWSRQ